MYLSNFAQDNNFLGRHGARYLSSSKSVDKIFNELIEASERKELTPLDEELLKIDSVSKQTNDLNNVENIWKDYEVSSMGVNIQWIFYKNEKI